MPTKTVEKRANPISFVFTPYNFEDLQHVIEKADKAGAMHRYLRGIASGSMLDAHGERMTENCIKSFMEQANQQDILLYADIHGIKYTEDIGIMTEAKILPDGDWYTEYRLYDASDGVDQRAVEIADKLWKQMKGLPPYTKPKNKGFSVEGYIPDEGILEMDEEGRRVLDQVELEGVLVVPRPAYQTSIAYSIYKALGEQAPWNDEATIQGRLRTKIIDGEQRDAYYRHRWQYDDALNELVSEVMLSGEEDRRIKLEKVFDEYKLHMIDLILKSENMFTPDESIGGEGLPEVAMAKQNLFKALLSSIDDLEKLYN